MFGFVHTNLSRICLTNIVEDVTTCISLCASFTVIYIYVHHNITYSCWQLLIIASGRRWIMGRGSVTDYESALVVIIDK